MADQVHTPAWPAHRRGGSKVEEVQRRERLLKILADYRQLFLEAARESPIVANAINVAWSHGGGQEHAWLIAAMALLEQNQQLMANARALIRSSPPPVIITEGDKQR
jgi:hypothetical protein